MKNIQRSWLSQGERNTARVSQLADESMEDYYKSAIHLLLAGGWVELGAYKEAAAEIDQLPESLRQLPKVSEFRSRIQEKMGTS